MAVESALVAAAKALERVAGKEVTFKSGSASVQVRAVKGQSTFHRVNQNQVVETIQSIDWLIRPTLLQLYGSEVEPKQSDKFEEIVGEKKFIYQVTAAPNGSTWRWSDASRTRMRIHTILVEETKA